MRSLRRALAAIPALPVAAAGLVAAQVLRAAHRSDLPSFPNQDPSGSFGSKDLPRLKVVAMGDSSITAPGVEDLDNAWVRRIAIGLAESHHVELISLAVGGAKSRDVVEGQLSEAVRLEPDLVILSVGANDSIRASPPERYRSDLHRIVEALEDVAGAIVVLGVGDLGSIPRLPKMLRPFLTRRAAVFDTAAAAVAAGSPRTVKVATSGRISTAFHRHPELFGPDQFHAGDEGHAVFAEEALPAVRAAAVIAGV